MKMNLESWIRIILLVLGEGTGMFNNARTLLNFSRITGPHIVNSW